jgi:hypothetical protein
VYALHNAVDLPARLPDGSTTDRSVSDAVAQRDLQLGRDPQGAVAEDLAAEQRIEAERQLERSAAGRTAPELRPGGGTAEEETQ